MEGTNSSRDEFGDPLARNSKEERR